MIARAHEGRIAILRIDRPDRAGALTAAMLEDLARAVAEEGARPETHAIVLTGTGRVFSAGADLDEVRAGTLATHPVWERLSDHVASAPVPVVAALNGTVAGGALGMVLASDMRLAVPQARAFYPVMKMGVLPQPSDPARLAALVGVSRAKMILMGGVELDAATALDWGLIDRISDDPLAEALDLLKHVEAAPRDRVAALKAMPWR